MSVLAAPQTEAVEAESKSKKSSRKAAAELATVQVTATLQAEDAGQIAAPVTIIGADKLQQNALTPIEALRGQPGAFVQQTTPGQSAVFVRSAKGSEVLHLVDGFRLNSAIFRNAPNQYFSLVDGHNLDRIELLRGSSAGLYGSDAMGGVVHMISRNPLDLAQNSSESSVRIRADSGEDMMLGHISSAWRGDQFAAQIAVTSVDTDGRRIGGGDQRPQSDFTSLAASARIGMDAADAGRFGLNLQTVRQPNTPRHDELVPGFGQTNAASAVALLEPQERQFAQFTHSADVDVLGFDRLNWQLGSQFIIDDRRTRARGSSSEARERNRDRLNGASLTLSRTHDETHGFSVGAEYYDDKVNSSRTNTNINTGVQVVAAPRFPDGASERSVALYAIDDWKINERWDLVLSGRYSDFKVELPQSGTTPQVVVAPNAFSGHVGASFALTENTRLVGNIGRGFRAPNVFDLGVFGDRPGNRFSIPNPDLDAERILGSDIGIKHNSGDFGVEAYVYESRFTDKIVSALTGAVTAGGRLIVQNRNAARAKSHGLELGTHWNASDTITARASINYTRGNETLDGVTSDGDRIPPLTFDVLVDWQLGDALLLSFGGMSAGRQDRLSERDLTDPRIDPTGTAGWTRWDIAARYAVTPNFDLLGRIDNIADHNYREHGSGINATGRNFTLGADLRF